MRLKIDNPQYMIVLCDQRLYSNLSLISSTEGDKIYTMHEHRLQMIR